MKACAVPASHDYNECAECPYCGDPTTDCVGALLRDAADAVRVLVKQDCVYEFVYDRPGHWYCQSCGTMYTSANAVSYDHCPKCGVRLRRRNWYEVYYGDGIPK